MHKVSEIIMLGNSDNTSCQSAEHVHIDLINAVAGCTDKRMPSCALCAFMLAVPICTTIRHCCKSCYLETSSPEAQSQSKVRVWSKYRQLLCPRVHIVMCSQFQCDVRDWYSIPILRGEVSTRNDVHPNLGKPEAIILELSQVYPLHIPLPSHTYAVYIQDISPDMSAPPTVTGRSEGQNGGCQPGSRASEAVESCSGNIRQNRTLRSAGHCGSSPHITSTTRCSKICQPS